MRVAAFVFALFLLSPLNLHGQEGEASPPQNFSYLRAGTPSSVFAFHTYETRTEITDGSLFAIGGIIADPHGSEYREYLAGAGVNFIGSVSRQESVRFWCFRRPVTLGTLNRHFYRLLSKDHKERTPRWRSLHSAQHPLGTVGSRSQMAMGTLLSTWLRTASRSGQVSSVFTAGDEVSRTGERIASTGVPKGKYVECKARLMPRRPTSRAIRPIRSLPLSPAQLYFGGNQGAAGLFCILKEVAVNSKLYKR